MTKPLALILATILAFSATACGSTQTAEQFCASHGGVNAATVEPDGDATCNDGTEFEADGDSSKKKSKTKTKSKKR